MSDSIHVTMTTRRLLLLGVLLALLLAGWAIHARARGRLQYVECRRPNGECFRTEDPAFLGTVEAWRGSIEGPSLHQRLQRLRGGWIENGLRQADYQVTLVYKNGRRDEMSVWVYTPEYVPVHWRGHNCLARSEPFSAFAKKPGVQ